MGIAERRAREKEELRRKILDAASELFVEEGFANVSMRRIAEKIEYAPSTIYLYFEDKHALTAAICYETFEKLNERIDAITARPLPGIEKLRRCLLEYIRFGISHPNHYTVAFLLPEKQYPNAGQCKVDSILQAGLQSLGRLREGLRLSMEAGLIRQEDLDACTQSVWMLIHGVTSLLVTTGRTFPFGDHEVLINSAVDKILRGLGAETAQATGR
jgi:AcrR family transcriptional regulator